MSSTQAPPVAGAVLFDLDGVLIDTDDSILELWRRIATRRSVAVPERRLRVQVLGCAPEHTVAMLFEGCPRRDQDAILAEVRLAEPTLGFRIAAGAPGLLRALTVADVPLALVTSASRERVARVAEALPGLRRFGVTVTWGEPSRGKPHPDPYLLAAERLGIAPERCVVFEDASPGVIAAVGAGMYCIGVGQAAAQELRASGAATVAPSLGEIGILATERGVQLVLAETAVTLSRTDTYQKKEATAWR